MTYIIQRRDGLFFGGFDDEGEIVWTSNEAKAVSWGNKLHAQAQQLLIYNHTAARPQDQGKR